MDGSDILVHSKLIRYILVKMQVNSWLTLQWLLWGAFQVKASRRLVSQSRIVGSINLTFNWYQRHCKCLQRSKSRRISTCLRVEHAFIRTSHKLARQYRRRSQVPELEFSCGYALDNIKSILIQSYATLWHMADARIDEWHSIRSTKSIPSCNLDIACCSLVKGCLTLWFCLHIWPEAMHSTHSF